MSVLKFGSQKENDKAKRRGLQPTGEKSTTEVQLQGKKKIIDINRKTLRLADILSNQETFKVSTLHFPGFQQFSHHHLVKDTDCIANARGSFAPQVFQVKKYVISEEELQVIKPECTLCMPLQFNIGN